ncbi:xylan glycosyltransferase MUCI21-like [Bidens hawaiensis]|uniref:xylan glycosyltransferase MUCI21-like n=1 Tax=Bidens hawaiensis TaxID=980011 RepID=UPI004049A57B
MVDYHRHIHLKKGANMAANHVHLDEEHGCVSIKRSRPKLLFFLTFCSVLSCFLILLPSLFSSSPSSTFSLLYSYEGDDDEALSSSKASLCSSVQDGTICCDRTSVRSDICIMKGDIRTNSSSFSVHLYNISGNNITEEHELQREKIKPYTRKWEPSTMATIDELTLISKTSNASTFENRHKCDVNHKVPAVFFSTGGFTGNVYHEFNDGLIPLYITSQKFNKKVVFVILEYHDWWIMKYGDVISRLSDYEPIDFNGDHRMHCFSEAIIGLRIHDELAINSTLMKNNETIKDFHDVLDKAYLPRIQGLVQEEPIVPVDPEKPKLVIISRNGSRAILNQNLLAKMAGKIGFEVEILWPDKTTELAKIYRSLNSSDVMVGVHGAAMTHFLFMRPGSVFIQVVPLGTRWAAETYYGGPAKKLGLRYIGYEILPQESSLYDEYERNDVVLTDPDSVNDRGWEFTKKIYLDKQKVKLNLKRFRKHLVQSHLYIMAKRNQARSQARAGVTSGLSSSPVKLGPESEPDRAQA